MMCKTVDVVLVPGYYDWNLYFDNELIYTFDDSYGEISEEITDGMEIDELRNIVELFVDAMLEEMGENEDSNFFIVNDNKKIIIDEMMDVWTNAFVIGG